MKKYIISISLMAVITGILLTSCQKEAAHETALQTKSADQLLEERILGFENITINPTKNGATMQLDSVLWYSEALLNYSNAEAYEELGAITVFKETISLAQYPDELTQVELAQLFSQFQQTISTELSENDIFVYADVQLVDSELKNSEEVVLVLAKGSGEINPYIFHDNDWWESHDELGRCSGYTGGVGRDAADVIAEMANRRKGSHSPNVYFPVIEDVDIFPDDVNDYYFNPWSFSDTYLFEHNSPHCLSPEQMEFYTNRLVEVTALHPHSNSNYILIAYGAFDDLLTGGGAYMHRGKPTYGEPHIKTPGE